MNEFTEYKLRALGEWLLRGAHSDEYCETNLLKVAISVEDATNTLNMSKRVPRAIKNIIWEMSEDIGQSLDYDKKDLEDFSDIYRDEILESVPNDLEPGDKAQSIQWLTSLGSKDKSFAKKTLLAALANLELARGSLSYKIETYLESKKEEFQGPRGIYRDSVVIHNKLEKFFNWKRFMSIRDLMSIKSLEQFFKVVDDSEEAIEEYGKNKEYLDAEAGTEVLGESDAWIAYVVKNKGAACKLGSGTGWCTAAPGTNWFGTYYHEKDPLFILENKRDKDERFQVHFGSMQFKDTNDEEVDVGVKANLNDILNKFGSEKYLSSQLYNAYLKALHGKQVGTTSPDNFRKEDRKHIPDLYAKTISYINEVTEDKIEEGNEPDSYSLPGVILDAVVTQIGNLSGDDDEVSDLTAKLLADYDPNSFFDVGGLDVDYPDLAKGVVNKAVNEEPSSAWTKEVMPFNLYDKFISGELLESGPVESFLKSDKETLKKIVDMTAKDNGLKMLLGTDKVAPGAQKIIDEFYPNLYNDIVETIYVMEAGDSSHPLSIRAGDSKVGIDLSNLIASGFHLKFAEKFNNILDTIVTILSKQGESIPGAYWLSSALDAMSEANIVEKYWKYYIELLRFGLKADFDRFSKYDNPSLPEDMRTKIHQLTVTEEVEYVESLVSGTDTAVPGWRDQDVDKETLYEIFSAIEGSNLSVGPFDAGTSRYKPVVEFYNKILSILKRKFYENSAVSPQPSSGARTKMELPREFLLYIATLLPGLWSAYNLEYRVIVPSEITAKAHRSMSKLEQEISLRKQDEPQKDSEDSEDDEDDWDDEDDF